MNDTRPGIILLSHGSRRPEVGKAFISMAGRLARNMSAPLLPAFFSLGKPELEDQVRILVHDGCGRIIIMPYFLSNGVHIDRDIPRMIEALQREFPTTSFVLLSTLQDDPAMEEFLLHRLQNATREKN